MANGLNSGSSPNRIAAGPDGNLWFTDHGTTSAIGQIKPATQKIDEFSVGLSSTSDPQPDGEVRVIPTKSLR
jgi:streptogramin lyase